MSTQTALSSELESAIVAISDERARWFAALRTLNESASPTGADVDALMRRSDEIDAEVEVLRRKYFPRAHQLIITTIGACTSSATGRSVKSVWYRPTPTSWD